MAVSMLKRKVIVDFLVNILITIWFRPQLPVLSPKNRSKPEVEQNGRKYAQTKSKSWLVYELIKNHMLPTSTSGFIAWKRDHDNPLVTLLPRLQREADGILVNLLPRAKREAKGILVNLLPRAKREAEGILVTLLPRAKRESIGILANLVPRAKREVKGILVNLLPRAKRAAEEILINLLPRAKREARAFWPTKSLALL